MFDAAMHARVVAKRQRSCRASVCVHVGVQGAARRAFGFERDPTRVHFDGRMSVDILVTIPLLPWVLTMKF